MLSFLSLVFCITLPNLSLIGHDVCDRNRIYDPSQGYEYVLPQPILENFLSGIGFDHIEPYSQEEYDRLCDDIRDLYADILSDNPMQEDLAVITAGAPGAGKTTKLKQDLQKNRLQGKYYAYVCPDDVCLKNQKRTYQIDIAASNGSIQARREAYDKWRPGSNAAAHLVLANLIREQYAFYFGTTSTSPHTCQWFHFLKKQGYKIRLLHISAPDDVRWKSIEERDKIFVQATEDDTMEKGQLLPQRILDTFLAYADEIEFYYRNGVHEDALLAARWFKNENTNNRLGTLDVVSPDAYEQIKNIHNAAIIALNRPDLCWECTVEENSTR